MPAKRSSPEKPHLPAIPYIHAAIQIADVNPAKRPSNGLESYSGENTSISEFEPSLVASEDESVCFVDLHSGSKEEAAYSFCDNELMIHDLSCLGDCLDELLEFSHLTHTLYISACSHGVALGVLLGQLTAFPHLREVTLKGLNDLVLEDCGALEPLPTKFLILKDFNLSDESTLKLFQLFPQVSNLTIHNEVRDIDSVLKAIPQSGLKKSLINLYLLEGLLSQPESLHRVFGEVQLEHLELGATLGLSNENLIAAFSAQSAISFLTLGFSAFDCLIDPLVKYHKTLEMMTLPNSEQVPGVSCWSLLMRHEALATIDLKGSDIVYESLHISSEGVSSAEDFFDRRRDGGGSKSSQVSSFSSDYLPVDLPVSVIMSMFAETKKDLSEAPEAGVAIKSWLDRLSTGAKLPESAASLLEILSDQYMVCPVAKDGDCYFLALDAQLPHDDEEQSLSSRAYRDLLCYELLSNPSRYALFLPNWDDSKTEVYVVNEYVQSMRQSGNWAGEIDSRVMSNVLGRPIAVVTCSANPAGAMQCRVTVYHPDSATAEAAQEGELLLLHYNGSNHYQPILPKDESINHQEITARFLAAFSDRQKLPAIAPAAPGVKP